MNAGAQPHVKIPLRKNVAKGPMVNLVRGYKGGRDYTDKTD